MHGDMAKARPLFEEAHRDGHPKAGNSIALVYSMQGDIDRAIRIWEEACEKGCADSAMNLGKTYLERGYFDQAITCFQKLHLEDNINGTFGLGEVYANLGNRGKAKELFQECLARGHPLAQRALDAFGLLTLDAPFLPSDVSRFVVGDRVMISGLESEVGQALNGCLGTVGEYDSHAHRFVVNVDGNKGHKLLKAENLDTWGMSNGPSSRPPRAPLVGDAVQIHGLKSCLGQLLNGCEGLVVSFDVSTGRRDVQLPGGGETYAIKPENLVIKTSPPSDPEYYDIQTAIQESVSSEANHLNSHSQAPAEVNAQISSALLKTADADSGPRVVLLKFSRRPRSFTEALLQAPELADCIEALQSHGFCAELQCGAKIFVRPEHYSATLEAIRLGGWKLFPNHVVTEVYLEQVVLGIVEKLPWRASVHPRGSHVVPLGFATSAAEHEGNIQVARTFVQVRLPTSLRSESHSGPRTASTTDMDLRKGSNHRGKRS